MARKRIVISDKGPIRLNTGDAAWVVRADGTMELHVPEDLDGDDEAPRSIVVLSAYATLGNRDPKLAEEIIRKFDEDTDGPEWGSA